MERRVLFAIFLCFIVIYVWQGFVVKPVPKPVPGSPQATTAPASATPPAGETAGSQAPTTAPPAVPEAPASTALVTDSAERDIRVETGDVVAVFTNRGARLKS